MTENKFTGKEIVKGLETCIAGDCDVCNCKCGGVGDCRDELNRRSLDLINRQQAEIEKSRENNRAIMLTMADVRTQAITEFAERLKKSAPTFNGMFYEKITPISVEMVDNLVKEMVGEEK